MVKLLMIDPFGGWHFRLYGMKEQPCGPVLGNPTADRGGRARRYHAVTQMGLRALRAAREAVTRLSTGLESTLGRLR
jgi:hypothetical protein